MLVSDIINTASTRLSSVDEFSPEELIGYINDADDYISFLLASVSDAEVVSSLVLTTPIAKPINWIGFSPPKSAYPAVFNNNMLERAVGAPPSVVIKYTTAKPHVFATSDTMPFPDMYKGVIIMLVCQFAQNRNEFDITQDKALSDMVFNALAKAKGG